MRKVSQYSTVLSWDCDERIRCQAFSFLCTFVPGSEKTIERTFAPVELSFRGTFAPGEQLSFHGTFAPVELSLLRSECSKNFRSMELSHPWNLRSTNNFHAL